MAEPWQPTTTPLGVPLALKALGEGVPSPRVPTRSAGQALGVLHLEGQPARDRVVGGEPVPLADFGLAGAAGGCSVLDGRDQHTLAFEGLGLLRGGVCLDAETAVLAPARAPPTSGRASRRRARRVSASLAVTRTRRS